MNPNHENQPVTSEPETNAVAVRNDHAKSLQFEEWLGQSLDELVERYSDFVTANSNRRFFSRQSDRR